MDEERLAALIERGKRRDPAAFDVLVEAYSGRLYGYVYRLTGLREDAEDLVQEVFVRLVRMLPDYEHDGRFEGWLFRIATNLARDRLRRRKRTQPAGSLDTFEAGDGEQAAESFDPADAAGPPPDGALELREDADALQSAIARLPAAEREVVMLRHFSELSFAEIAELMGTPLGTALARAHRGLNKLRTWMREADECRSRI